MRLPPKPPGESSGHSSSATTTVASMAADAISDLPRSQRACSRSSGSFSRMQPDRLPISLMDTPPRKAPADSCFLVLGPGRLKAPLSLEIVRRLWVRVPLQKIDTANAPRFPAYAAKAGAAQTLTPDARQ